MSVEIQVAVQMVTAIERGSEQIVGAIDRAAEKIADAIRGRVPYSGRLGEGWTPEERVALAKELLKGTIEEGTLK